MLTQVRTQIGPGRTALQAVPAAYERTKAVIPPVPLPSGPPAPNEITTEELLERLEQAFPPRLLSFSPSQIAMVKQQCLDRAAFTTYVVPVALEIATLRIRTILNNGGDGDLRDRSNPRYVALSGLVTAGLISEAQFRVFDMIYLDPVRATDADYAAALQAGIRLVSRTDKPNVAHLLIAVSQWSLLTAAEQRDCATKLDHCQTIARHGYPDLSFDMLLKQYGLFDFSQPQIKEFP